MGWNIGHNGWTTRVRGLNRRQAEPLISRSTNVDIIAVIIVYALRMMVDKDRVPRRPTSKAYPQLAQLRLIILGRIDVTRNQT